MSDKLPPPFIDRAGKKSGEQSAARPLAVGRSDLDPFAQTSPGEGGMLMGPDHPGFWQDAHSSPKPAAAGGSQGLDVPPGARFDPVTPIKPGSIQGIPSGDPDNDELMPPGGFINPVDPSWKPPRPSKKPNHPSNQPFHPPPFPPPGPF